MFRLRVVLFFTAVIVLSGCATTSPSVEDEPVNTPIEEVEEAAPIVTFVNQGGSLVAKDLPAGMELKLGVSGSPVFTAISPNGERVVVGVESASQSDLYLYDIPKQTHSVLFSGGKGTVFSGQWNSASSNFYFGQYMPDGNRMGAGSIHVYSGASGETRKVPCSASRFVLSLLPAGSLLVRNSDSIYEVAISDCATIKTIDARKMYSVAVSPKGDRMAYILRDLVYNREKRAYEPDSTLYLSLLGSSAEPVKIIGDKYQPRNMAWSPDGTELAYDVIAQDGSKKRAISIYSIESAGSAYLEPPQSTLRSNTHPRYSRDGRHILFRSASPANEVALKWKSSGQPFSQTVPLMAEAPLSSWTWVGADTLFLKDKDGRSGLFSVSSEAGSYWWTGANDVILSYPIGQ